MNLLAIWSITDQRDLQDCVPNFYFLGYWLNYVGTTKHLFKPSKFLGTEYIWVKGRKRESPCNSTLAETEFSSSYLVLFTTPVTLQLFIL